MQKTPLYKNKIFLLVLIISLTILFLQFYYTAVKEFHVGTPCVPFPVVFSFENDSHPLYYIGRIDNKYITGECGGNYALSNVIVEVIGRNLTYSFIITLEDAQRNTTSNAPRIIIYYDKDNNNRVSMNDEIWILKRSSYGLASSGDVVRTYFIDGRNVGELVIP